MATCSKSKTMHLGYAAFPSRPSEQLAVRNALRYFPTDTHEELATEFAAELDAYGHIYMYRLLPSIVMRYSGVWHA